MLQQATLQLNLNFCDMTQLKRNELKVFFGGVRMNSTCTADCGQGSSVTCSGSANCDATDAVGCHASSVDSNGNVTHDDKSCLPA